MSKAKPRKLKKRAWWWSWAEWEAQNETQAEVLRRLRKRSWGPAGRIEMVEFMDGSFEIRIPCSDGPSRMTHVIRGDA